MLNVDNPGILASHDNPGILASHDNPGMAHSPVDNPGMAHSPVDNPGILASVHTPGILASVHTPGIHSSLHPWGTPVLPPAGSSSSAVIGLHPCVREEALGSGLRLIMKI